MQQYHDLVRDVLENGTLKENRTGVNTLYTFSQHYTIDISESFPLMTTKDMSGGVWNSLIKELLWFLRGDISVEKLTNEGVHIWDSWQDHLGTIGPGYGKQWRRWQEVTVVPSQWYDPSNVTLDPSKKAGVGFDENRRGDSTPSDHWLYQVWFDMLRRCYDPTRSDYGYYGGKGVHVHERWFDFDNFLEDVRQLPNWNLKLAFPDEYSLDKDFYGSNLYGPETCLWLSRQEQSLNSGHVYPVKCHPPVGPSFVAMCLDDLVQDYGLDRSHITKVLKGHREHHKGWRFEAMEYPKHLRPRVQIIDQIKRIVALLKTNPNSRRMVLSAWNAGKIEDMVLPPCHAFVTFSVDGQDRLNCHLTQRSGDIGLGVPFNIASYAALTYVLAKASGRTPGKFSHTIVDAHIYCGEGEDDPYSHVPALREQLTRDIREAPRLKILGEVDLDDPMAFIENLTFDDFVLEGYDPHPRIRMKVAV